MFHKNWVTRFILRKDFFQRVKKKIIFYKRIINKELVEDIAYLYHGEQPPVIFDVGANVGFVTHQFRTLFPNADIYSFEPNPSVYEALQKNYENDRKVHPIHLGIGDQNGQILFHINANSTMGSFLQPSNYQRMRQSVNSLKSQPVNVVSLDEFTQKNKITHINILKLDIEGYEIKALEGAKSLLTKQKIEVILTEVNIVRIYEGQPLFHHISAFLEEHDYHLFNIDGFVNQETRIRQGIYMNAVYLSGNMRKKIEQKFGIKNCGW